ncbi:MAG: ABC transporter permease [Chloroflexi bacterium]|nr:ABC transporter permease [Chloroflexota bacterium]MBV9602049.1 ABC transporter permease [Chloroflexota bacterium]
MTAPSTAIDQPVTPVNDRVSRTHALRRLLVRPEMGAVAGSIAVWIFFAVVAGKSGFLSFAGTATYLQVAAELGIMAVAVALLMISGEFDLSIGSILGATGMVMTALAVQFNWNIWLAMLAALVLALAVGVVNGYLVLRTGLPSFIVTLATLYVIRGATIGSTRLLTGRTQIGGLDQASGFGAAKAAFASTVTIGGAPFAISIVWWLVIAAVATWLLLRTSFGNWIFGCGGSVEAARNVGVPVSRVKILLFMGTAAAACLVAIIQAVEFTGTDVLRGTGQEFFAIIAVVVGGTLLTGGYGSAIGAVFGALIFGMVRQGIVFARVDADWFQVFLGLMLLIAVLINRLVRERAMKA